MMRIVRAEAMGMCFGVRRAIKTALEIPDPHEVTINGELVHNEEVNRELRRRGFRMHSEGSRSGLPGTRKILITAHGISNRGRKRLEEAGRELIDTTCPLVRRIHATAQSLQRQGYFVIVIGKRDHVEVQGIVEDLSAGCVVSRPKEVAKYQARRLGVISQSTTAPSVAQEILGQIYAKNPGKEIYYVATFCEPTKKRQAAVRSLLHEVDALVVVGGKNSNNTRELVKLARSHRMPCTHVETAEDLDPDWFEPFDVVGLTAGTSTPDEVIEAVYGRLMMIGKRKREPALVH